jgi:hypothetical protein
MADTRNSSKEASLEMRVAAIEDKLSQLNITEDEMRTYSKVSSILAGRGGSPGAGPSTNLDFGGSWIFHWWPPIQYWPIFNPIIVRDCIQYRPAGLAGTEGGVGSQFGSLGQQGRQQDK